MPSPTGSPAPPALVTIAPCDPELCTACGLCASVCPADVFAVDPLHRVKHAGRCILCGHCVAVCPASVLRHSRLPFGEFKRLPDPPPIPAEGIDALLKTRRSIRRFAPQPVPRSDIEAILDASRYSPASTNTRNLQWLLVDDPKTLDRLVQFTARYYLTLARRISNPLVRFWLYLTVGKRIVDSYALRLPAIVDHFEKCRNGQDLVFYGAPVVGIASAPGMEHLALANINLALGQILVSVHGRGLGTLISGYALTALRRDRSLWDELGIPRHHHVGAVAAFGRPDVTFRLLPPRPLLRMEWIDR